MKYYRGKCHWILVARTLFVVPGLLLQNTSPAAVSRDFGLDVSHYDGSSGVSQSSWNQL
jgi:hypothetical protein